MRKYDFISALAKETAAEVVKNCEEWMKYLTTAARLYKYPFREQLLIYAQRPDPTACASIELWNERMHCWVNKGAKGIALLDEDDAHGKRLKYVFDVSDVHAARRIGRYPELWELHEEHKEDVIKRLEQTYGATDDKKLFEERLMEMVECLKGIYGWNVRVTDKTVTFATSDMKKGIRGNKLGDGYGKAELVERIAQIVTEREEVNEARRIAEEQAKAKAEAAAREEAIRKKKQIEEERKKAEILSRKRKLAYERNNIQHKYYSAELDRPDWNREYVEYLDAQFIRDAALLSEEELIAPIMTREEFEKEQAVVLYREKADKAGELWDKALSELSSVTHKWKWEYMDYLEEIRFKDLSNVTPYDAKEEILSYEEFASIKEEGMRE